MDVRHTPPRPGPPGALLHERPSTAGAADMRALLQQKEQEVLQLRLSALQELRHEVCSGVGPAHGGACCRWSGTLDSAGMQASGAVCSPAT